MSRSIPLLGAALLAACAPLPSPDEQLPVAVPNAQLAPDAALTRIAFGSCNVQRGPQHVWNAVAASDPQLFIAMGDNVYEETGEQFATPVDGIVSAYRALNESASFNALRRTVPMLVTWDDHDFGPNDAGGSFEHRARSEQAFEHYWNAPQEARDHPGVYHHVTFGPQGQRVQVIMLDARFFRSDMVRLPQETDFGRFAANTDPSATVLGEVQWVWLERALAEPADLRVLVSSVQVLSNAHGWEAWNNFPLEQSRLLDMLVARAPSGLVILSGDRHAAAIYGQDWNGEEIVEFTSSSLNSPMSRSTAEASAREPDPLRLTPMVTQANFGTMDIDWPARTLTMTIRSDTGAPIETVMRGF